MGIRIDEGRCLVNDCTACLQACEKRVLGRFPRKPRKNRLSRDFVLEIVFPQYCSDDCTDCAEACPESAIILGPGVKTRDIGNKLLGRVLLRLHYRLINVFFREAFRYLFRLNRPKKGDPYEDKADD